MNMWKTILLSRATDVGIRSRPRRCSSKNQDREVRPENSGCPQSCAIPNQNQLRLSLLLLECKDMRFAVMEATLSSKGQATIPKAVRDRLHLKSGDRFKFFFHADGVIILPKIPTSRLRGVIPRPARPVSLEEIDAAIVAGATQRFRRKK